MKTISLFLPFTFLFQLVLTTQAQVVAKNNPTLKWEASVSSGIFADLLYADISLVGDTDLGGGPVHYSDKSGKKVKFGKVDRVEFKYNFNPKASVSLNFGYALWHDIYGIENDPLELWKETKRYKKRIQFAGNYYRNFHTNNKKGVFNTAIGFLIQGEQNSFPFYEVSATDPSHILYLDAGNLKYWWDWGTQLTASYYHTINPNLKIGAIFYTYIIGTDVEGAGLMGSIAIPFGQKMNR